MHPAQPSSPFVIPVLSVLQIKNSTYFEARWKHNKINLKVRLLRHWQTSDQTHGETQVSLTSRFRDLLGVDLCVFPRSRRMSVPAARSSYPAGRAADLCHLESSLSEWVYTDPHQQRTLMIITCACNRCDWYMIYDIWWGGYQCLLI